ncbi:MAG TPA: family 78 glycoside hydrolase catalytic domain [Steroidobacteraceae bacterium]|jgi:alpha-L-rhamnosidase|nr:family 78 glycoside hydrolase catalytic domain [Steroidobacteraceae bacterium]
MARIDRRRLLLGTSLLATAPTLLRPAAADAAADDAPAEQATLTVGQLWTERIDCPLGVEVSRPRFSWALASVGRGARQSAYRVTAASSRESLEAGEADLWDSGRIAADSCLEVAYDGKVLHSGQRVWWRVQVWDGAHRPSAASAATWFEMGLLEPSDWQGEWLDIEDPEERADREAGAQWIWSEAIRHAPGPQQFRCRLDLREPAIAAELLLAAKDDLLGVWIDGKAATLPAKSFWGTMLRLPLPAAAGPHVIAVQAKAETGGFMPGTGGGVAALVKVRQAGGDIRRLTSGEDWRASSAAPPAWQALEFDDGSWARARAISVPCDPRPPRAAQWARRQFNVSKSLARARLYATALGAYEIHVNSQRVGTARLAPEISVAADHVLYQCHDATALLKQGSNDITALIGDGWYASAFSWNNERYSFDDSPRRFLAQLVLDYADGSREIIATDASWQLAASAVRSSEIYNGEDYDARIDGCGCSESGQHVAASPWRPAAIGAAPATRLVAQIGPPIRALQSLAPRRITQPRPGVFVFDFGQNFAGWCRLHVRGPAGTVVRLRYAEILRADGEVDQSNLRGARATDTYTLRGEPAEEAYEPHFTYHGFRYVEVTGFPGKPGVDSLEGLVAHTDARQTGTLSLDNALAQHIWHNALWSQRSNFFGVPTDCPQRDERMGWMGDIQVFLDAAAFNMDVDAFIRRFMAEVRAGQTPDGAFPIVTPQPRSFPGMVTAGWSDAGVILPWTLYRRYGDTAVIEENWQAMQRWLDYVSQANPDFIWRQRRGLDLGDWLSVDAKSPSDETTPKALVATAFWARCASLMAEMAAAIGHADDAAGYARLRANIEQAFTREFVQPDGKVGNDSQTGYSLALRFGLVPAALRGAAGARLAADIERRGTRLSTGFLGTPYLLDALADTGHEQLAISLLLQTKYPSWGYMIAKGATTMWERWNGDVGDVAMNSYNHYAFGAVVGFMYRRLAGIAEAAPGFRRIAIDPIFDPRIGRVRARYDSCLGPIASEIQGGRHGLRQLALELPANSVAEVRLPGRPHDWLESGRPLGTAAQRLIGSQSSHFVVELGSGKYHLGRRA